MLTFEPPAPENLLELQEWFGAMISQPIQPTNQFSDTTPFGTNPEEEAKRFILPSPTLKPHKRLELYHQQYWWRILKSLEENFPMVVRLLGKGIFTTQFAIPYLTANPPSHWALCKLGSTFPQWIEKNYVELDQELILQSALIDWSSQEAFGSKVLPSLTSPSLSPSVVLQPHIHLFALKGDLFSFREAFLKEDPEYWNDHPFPEMRFGKYYAALFKNTNNQVTWKELSEGEYNFLFLLKEGLTIESVIEKIETEGGAIFEEALEMMPLWFREWTLLQWFGEK